MPSRRCFLAYLIAAPCAVSAHDGHDLSQIYARILSAKQSDGGYLVAIELENGRQQPIVLNSVYSSIGPIEQPGEVSIAPGAVASLELFVQASESIGIFTIILDFGDSGYGPVIVFPLLK